MVIFAFLSSHIHVYENNPVARPVDARHSIESETGKAVTLCLESEMFQHAKTEAKARVKRQSMVVETLPPIKHASLLRPFPELESTQPDSPNSRRLQVAVLDVSEVVVDVSEVSTPISASSKEEGAKQTVVSLLAVSEVAVGVSEVSTPISASSKEEGAKQTAVSVLAVSEAVVDVSELSTPISASSEEEGAKQTVVNLLAVSEAVVDVSEVSTPISSSSEDEGARQTIFSLPELPEVNWQNWMPCLSRIDAKKRPSPVVDSSSESSSDDEN
jgi:hypothetical protein